MSNNIAANLFAFSNGTEEEKNMITKETQIELSRMIGQFISEHPEKFRFIEFPDLISTHQNEFDVVVNRSDFDVIIKKKEEVGGLP